jgi:hypothetical protein
LEIQHSREFLQAQIEMIAVNELVMGNTPQGSKARAKALISIFESLAKCVVGLRMDSNDEEDEEEEGTLTLAELITILINRLQHNLLQLSQFMAGRKKPKQSDLDWAKSLYSQALKLKTEDLIDEKSKLADILDKMTKEIVNKLKKL